MFRSLLFDHLQGAIFRAQCCYCFSACLRCQVVYLVCGCILSMCVMPDVLVCTHKYISHSHTQVSLYSFPSYASLLMSWYKNHGIILMQIIYSHIPNKQLDDANKQRSSNSTKHGKRHPEVGQTRVTETFRDFNYVIYKHF